jgi:hypothetical protein
MKRALLIALFASLELAPACLAHVGSPDVFFQGNAGPYHLVATIRTPPMIPGVAQIEIRSEAPGLRDVMVTPLYINGDGSKYPPPPDMLQPAAGDGQFFSGSIWLMDSGSWQVRVQADGALGAGTVAIPVPAFARSTLPMPKSLGAVLLGLLVLLVAALVAIFGAARCEGTLEPGEQPGPEQKRGARKVMAATLAITIAALAGGDLWWTAVATANTNRKIYRPPSLGISLVGDEMNLHIAESGWHARRQDTGMGALIADHGHLMHLFLVRAPDMDRLYHLHPQQDSTDPASFVDALPDIAAGHYRVFADIVRSSGFPDTMVKEIDIPQTSGRPLAGDDSEVMAAPLTDRSAGQLVAPLTGGAHMIWERDPGPMRSSRLLWFRFRVDDATGKPVTDLEPYMGMAGHAEFIASDFSVFAHVHPEGSVSMAALALAGASWGSGPVQDSAQTPAAPGMNMSAMAMPGMPGETAPGSSTTAASAEVSFPYGFPKAGLYRIFIQVKRKGKVETGVFDANVN